MLEASTPLPAQHGRRAFAGVTRADLVAVAGLFLATMAVVGDALFDTERVVSHTFGDVFRYFLPYRAFGYRELAVGNLPLWNPYTFSGAPFVGGFQSAMFYPFNLIHLVLPLAVAVNGEVAFHLFLGSAFMYAWARSRTLEPPAAAFAAIVCMCGGAVSLRVLAGQLTVLATIAWVPLVLLTVDRLLIVPSLGWVLLGAFAATMQSLAGYPAFCLMTAIVAAAYLAPRIASAARPVATLAALGVIGVMPLLLGAVQTWPGLETAAETVRAGGASYSWASQFSFPPENLLTLLVPGFFGDIINVPYWGRVFFWDTSLFVGVVGLVLAIVGARHGEREHRRHLVALVLLCTSIALGRHLPVHELFYNWIPGVGLIRAPSKFAFFSAVFLALLAGAGAQRILTSPPRLGPFAVVAVAAASALLASVVVLRLGGATALASFLAGQELDPENFFRLDPPQQPEALGMIVAMLAIAAATLLAVAALLRRAERSPRAAVLLVALGMAELICFARFYRGGFPVATRGASDVDAFYGHLASDLRVLDFSGGHNGVNRNRCMDLGGHALWGYDPVVLRRYAEFVDSTQPDHFPLEFRTSIFQPRAYHPLLGMLRCAYLVRPTGTDGLELPELTRRLVASEQTRVPLSGDEIVPLDGALPRFLLVGDYRVLKTPENILDALLSPGFDPRHSVVLETAPHVLPAGGSPVGRIVVHDESTDHVSVEVETDRNAILVMTDSYSEGWRARSEAADAPQDYVVMPANRVLRAIALRRGRHRLRIEYSPTGFRYGRWVSLVSGMAYLGVLAHWARRRRNDP